MKHTWLLGALAAVMLASGAAAQTQPQTPSQSKPTTQTPSGQPSTSAQKPTTGTAKPTTGTQKPATGAEKPAPTTEKPQPAGTPARQRGAARAAEVPSGEAVLGTVSIPRNVMADGKPLSAGRYTVRLTAQTAQPPTAGQMPDLNRWVEFVQGGTVKGREVVSIVPAEEVKDTQPGPDLEPGRNHVPSGGSRVEMLKGGEYLRVWFNKGGNNYLVHLPPAGGAARGR